MTKLLLIEDNGDHGALIQQVIESSGDPYEITWKKTMASALECLRETKIDLVLLDLSLPDCEVDQTLSAVLEETSAPVIVLTSMDDKDLAVNSIREGAEDFYFKSEITEGQHFVKSIRFALERFRLNSELKDKTHLLEVVYQNIGEGLIVADKLGNYTLWNRAARTLLGDASESDSGPADWIASQELFEIDGITPIEEKDRPINQAIRGAGVKNRKLLIKNKTFRKGLYIVATATPLPLGGGVSIFRDITQQVEADRRLKSYAKDLERSNDELENFAHIASHDLQEPLRKVRSYSQILVEDCGHKLTGGDRDNLDVIVRSVTRMQDLIEDLLKYSRVGRDAVKAREVNVRLLVEGVLDMISSSVKETGAKVVLSIPEAPIKSDHAMLQRVFLNLISNALKFSPNGRVPIIEVGANYTSSNWHFWVKDNGIGMDKSEYDKIFVIFQRLHGRGKYPGTGIGLAICKRIVEKLGGAFEVESNLGQGTTFHFKVPRQRESII